MLFHWEEAFEETAAALPVHVRQVKALSEDFSGRMENFSSLPPFCCFKSSQLFPIVVWSQSFCRLGSNDDEKGSTVRVHFTL